MIWQTVKAFWQITQEPVSSDCTSLLLGSRCLSGNSWPGLLQTSDGCWVCAEQTAVSPMYPSPLCLRALIISREFGVVWEWKWVHWKVRSPPLPVSPQPSTDPVLLCWNSSHSSLCQSFFFFFFLSNPNPLQFSVHLISFPFFVSYRRCFHYLVTFQSVLFKAVWVRVFSNLVQN